MPTLVASYQVDGGFSHATMTTPSFTPSTGELIVIKGGALPELDDVFDVPTASGGGITWTQRVSVWGSGGSRYAEIWTGVVTVGGSPITVSLPTLATGPEQLAMLVERWSSARVADTPVVVSGADNTGSAPNLTLTTTAANSVISSMVTSNVGGSGATRAYRSSATEDGYLYISSRGTFYWAWQSAASAGAQSVGMTAPSAYRWTLAGIEILDVTGSRGSTTIQIGSSGTGRVDGTGSGSTTIQIASVAPPATIQVLAVPDPMASPPRVRLDVSALVGQVPRDAPVTILRTDPDGLQRRVITPYGARLSAGLWSGFDYHPPFNEVVSYTVGFGALVPGQPVTTGYWEYSPSPNLLPSSTCALGRAGVVADSWSSAWGSTIAAGTGSTAGAVTLLATQQYAAMASRWIPLRGSTALTTHTLAFEISDLTGYNDGSGSAGQMRLYIDWQLSTGEYVTSTVAAPVKWPSAGRALVTVSGTRPFNCAAARVAMYFVESLQPGRRANIAVWGVTLQEGSSVAAIPAAQWVTVPTTQARLDSTRTWLCHPSDPSLSAPVDAVTEVGDRTRASAASLHWAYGAKYPIAITSGVRRARTGTVQLRVDSPDAADQVRRLLSADSPVWVNMAAEDMGAAWWDDPYGWVQPGDVTDINRAGWVGYPYRHISLPYTEIDVPTAYLVA